MKLSIYDYIALMPIVLPFILVKASFLIADLQVYLIERKRHKKK